MVPPPSRTDASRSRGLSPVVGSVLLVGIALLLSVLAATMVLGLVEDPDPAPTARFDVDEGSCGHVIRHVAGDPVQGDRVDIHGVDDPDALADRRFGAGDSQRVEAVDDEVLLRWSSRDGDESYVVGRLDVDADADGGRWACPGSVYTSDAATIDTIEGDGGDVTSLSATSDASALGPAEADLTGDGTEDLPFVDGGGTLQVTNATNGTETLADGSDIPGDVESSKTRLGVGSWNGSEPSVFFVNENHDTLYRASPSGTPVAVASPGDGVQAVSGIGDVDGDGTDELVFADASQQLRYLEPDGTVRKVPNGGVGSDTGIGGGALADLDGDGTATVVVVDGSNDLKTTGESTADGGEGTTTLSEPDAAKAPPTAADVDGDGADEVLYVGLADGKVKYVHDVGGANEVRYLTDDAGDRIDGSDLSGLV